MPRFIPVPWFRWRRFHVNGTVLEQGSGAPIPGLLVRAFDKDVLRDDHLGDSETGADGRFSIRFNDSAFKDAIEEHPDIYLCVFAAGVDEPIHDTSVRQDAGREEVFEIVIPKSALTA